MLPNSFEHPSFTKMLWVSSALKLTLRIVCYFLGFTSLLALKFHKGWKVKSGNSLSRWKMIVSRITRNFASLHCSASNSMERFLVTFYTSKVQSIVSTSFLDCIKCFWGIIVSLANELVPSPAHLPVVFACGDARNTNDCLYVCIIKLKCCFLVPMS